MEYRDIMRYNVYIYIYLGKFDHDLTVLPHWKSYGLFLVNYYNLPRYIHIVHVCIYDSNNNMEYRDIMGYNVCTSYIYICIDL